MADQEQIERLKRSVKEWNQWRREHPEIWPDLSRANFRLVNLTEASIDDSPIEDILSVIIFSHADLSHANLNHASLFNVDLSSVYLWHADLGHADLSHTKLSSTYLSEADLTEAIFSHTTFTWVNLSEVKGLETAIHFGPSAVDINSVILPRDEHTRNHFLRGVGFTETQIEYLPSLLTPRPIQYSSLFISYTHQDETIAKRLYTDLRKKDVPCWFAPHDLRPGTPILRGIEEAIHLQEKFLLILSKYAVNSAWIEREVDAVLHQEIKRGQDVLFPIRLDNAVLESSAGWATRLQHRHIGDFTGWQDEAMYQEAFSTLLRHLKVSRPPQV